MNKLLWVAIAAGAVVAALAFVTRRPRDAKSRSKLGFRALQKAPLDEIAAALRAGRKIDAIRLLRESTGIDLAQAKDAVEEIERNLPLFERIGIDEPER